MKINRWVLTGQNHYMKESRGGVVCSSDTETVTSLTLLGLGLIKINDVSANFNNPRPSLILNN